MLRAYPAQRGDLDELPVRHAAVALAIGDFAVRVAIDVVADLVLVVVLLAHGRSERGGLRLRVRY